MKKWICLTVFALSIQMFSLANDSGDDKLVLFKPGDIVVHTPEELLLFRDRTEIAKIRKPGAICAGKDATLWVADIEDGVPVLRDYSSPGKFKEYKGEAVPGLIRIHKLLSKKDRLFILISTKRDVTEGQVFPSEFIQLLPFSVATKKFSPPIPLRNNNSKPEILLTKSFDYNSLPPDLRDSPSLGIWDAVFLSNHGLIISSQASLYAYRIVDIPEHHSSIFKEGDIPDYGTRTARLCFTEGKFGNCTGIASASKSKLLVVDQNKPGRVTEVDLDNPSNSKTFTPEIDDLSAKEHGFGAICLLENEILVANRHGDVKKIYRIDRKTGKVTGTYADGIFAYEIIVLL